MTLIKRGWLENGLMSSSPSAVVLELRMSETGGEVIPVPLRLVPPAWIIHTLLNSDRCSKISAFLRLWSVWFLRFLPSLVRMMNQLTAGWSRRKLSTKSCFSIRSNPGELFGLRLCGWPALCNPGRLFIREIFSKPSPSSESPTFSQPCTASWHAAAAALHRGPRAVEDSLLLRSTTKKGSEVHPVYSTLSHSLFLSAWYFFLQSLIFFFCTNLVSNICRQFKTANLKSNFQLPRQWDR